jgi:hypothetical protein
MNMQWWSCLRNNFIVALPFIICSFRIRLESSDVTRIQCNAVPPDRVCRVNPTLKPVFRSAETGGGRAITGTAMKRQNSLKITKY